MADKPADQPTGTPQNRKTRDAGTGTESPMEDKTKTPGDGTLQDATPAGLSSDELRKRAEDTEGSAQPGTG